MLLKSIDLVRLHVENIAASAAWYQSVFQMSPTENDEFYVEFRFPSGHGLAIAKADIKNPLSVGGSTVYWKVENFVEVIEHFKKHGAMVYRGPLDVPDGTTICQIKDPFGNVIGLVSTKSV